MTKDNQPSRFKSLLDKRKQVDAEAEPDGGRESSLPIETLAQDERRADPNPGTKPRQVGRPRGRRSDPDYTQISAYIPLDLLLDIQDELAKEKRRLRQRSAATVSELAENLLRDWLNQRKGN